MCRKRVILAGTQTKRELNNGFVWGAGGRGLVGDKLSRHLVDLYCRHQADKSWAQGRLAPWTGEFRIPACLFLRESEANAGQFSPRRQTKMRKLRLNCRKKRKFETFKGFRGLKTYLQAWEIIVSNSKRKISSSSLRKTMSLTRNWPNSGQCRSEFNENEKMVSKSLNKVIP